MSTLAATNLKNPSSGSDNIVLNTNGTTTIGKPDVIRTATAVAPASGTSVDFTGLDSWVKRITVMMNGISTSGTSAVQIQIGASGTFTTTGYAGSSTVGATTTNYSSGFVVHTNLTAATAAYVTAVLVEVDGNTWLENHSASSASSAVAVGNGGITLSGALGRVRITTVGGSDTFDAGTINLLLEG